MSPIALHPPLTGSLPAFHRDHGQVAQLEGPAWVRTRAGGRWHRPRSGVSYPGTILRPEPYVAWQMWCGVHAFSTRSIKRDALPDDGLPCCATCEGRAVGAGYPALLGQQYDAATIFSPRDLSPPSRCPGSRTIPRREDGRLGVCDACGDTHAMRAGGGAYTPSWGLVNHPPGPGLVLGCEFHAWRHLVVRERDGQVMCECEVDGPARRLVRG